MFIPKSDVLWICLLINNELRDKIYNCKGRCQPGHLPDFFCGGWIAPYTTPGGIDKSTERLFPRCMETFPHPPITLREGFDIFSPKKNHLPAISWLKWVFQRYHITYKKTKRPQKKPDISPVGTSLALLLLCHGVVLSPLLSCLCSLITIWKCECAGWDLSGYY